MKKLWFLSILFLFVVLFMPCSALAENVPVFGDWEVDLSAVGDSSGSARVYLLVRNTSSTEHINRVSIDFAPGKASQQSIIKDVNIPPNHPQRIVFDVNIDPSDIGSSFQAQVGMSQSSSTGVDGWGFINGVTFEPPDYTVSISVGCTTPVIQEGESIDISMSVMYSGNENVRTSIIDQNGNLISSSEDMSPGGPSQAILEHTLHETTTFIYTIYLYTQDGVGTLVNQVSSSPLTITVNPIPPNCEFNIFLSADKTTVNAGEDVNFDVEVHNTGDALHSIGLTDMDAMSLGNYEGIPTGSIVHLPITQHIDESCDVSFVVAGIIGDTQVYKQTNTIHITVAEEVTPSPIPSTTQQATPSPSPSAVETTDTDGAVETVDAIENSIDTNNTLDKNMTMPKNIFWLIIVLIALCILVIITTIVIFILLKKNKNSGNNQKI